LFHCQRLIEMNDEPTKHGSRTDWTRVDAMRDEDIDYFDCLPQEVRIVVYTNPMEPIGYAVSSGRSAQAHCVASAFDAPSAYATSSHTEMPRARSSQCLGESGVR